VKERITMENDYVAARALVEESFHRKIGGLHRKLSFVADAFALFRFMNNSNVHWSKKAIVAAALLYFILPVDSIPDIAPLVGYLDDAGVLAAAVRYIANRL
jgi:uncharacterized membrane protein YkvA (DUF1232 family)